jgi:hypothetical protein
MNDLRRVLAKYSARPATMGGPAPAPSDASTDQARTESLRNDLKNVSDKNRLVFFLCVAMVLALFVGACWLVLTHLQDTKFIQGVLAVTGISFAGLISQMVRLWKVKVSSDMILVLASSLNASDTRSILEILLKTA